MLELFSARWKGLWVGKFGSEVAVVFEDVRGQWLVSQWL